MEKKKAVRQWWDNIQFSILTHTYYIGVVKLSE